jgi:hypothetical protein
MSSSSETFRLAAVEPLLAGSVRCSAAAGDGVYRRGRRHAMFHGRIRHSMDVPGFLCREASQRRGEGSALGWRSYRVGKGHEKVFVKKYACQLGRLWDIFLIICDLYAASAQMNKNMPNHDI